MSDHSSLALVEFQELRATIRQRGTLKIALLVGSLIAWATLAYGLVGGARPPVACLIPLMILAAGFEGVRVIHIGVERIGRYLQVYYEAGVATPPAWEHVAMLPRTRQGLTAPSLFGTLFIPAVMVNLAPVGLSGSPTEWAIYGLAHLGVITYMIRGHVDARRQRAADLAWLAEIRTRRSRSDAS